MRTRWRLIPAAVMAAGAAAVLLVPVPAEAQKKEIIQLQTDMNRLIDAQRDLQRAVDEKYAVQKTLIEQTLDAISKLNLAIGGLQKTMQDVQANSGASLESLRTQVQALADGVEEVKARLGRINQQLADQQGALQTLEAKLAGPAPSAGSAGGATSTAPPPSADLLYNNALRDWTGGRNDLARQQFQDYLKYYSDTDLASNAQFYLGEILYAEKKYAEAINEYDKVLQNYPKSFKLAPARLKKGLSQLELNQRSAGVRELREVVRRFPGTEEARRAQAKLRELGVSATGASR